MAWKCLISTSRSLVPVFVASCGLKIVVEEGKERKKCVWTPAAEVLTFFLSVSRLWPLTRSHVRPCARFTFVIRPASSEIYATPFNVSITRFIFIFNVQLHIHCRLLSNSPPVAILLGRLYLIEIVFVSDTWVPRPSSGYERVGKRFEFLPPSLSGRQCE